MAERIEILISGFGGQGVVRIGQILGQAAVYEGLFTTMLISHGTETRGGYVRSQLVISDEFIDSPVVERPDYFCAFSAIAYGMFKVLCTPQSLILHNPDLVTPDSALSARHWAIRAESLAERELGNAVFANVIFLGALSSKLKSISSENLVRALQDRLPPRYHEQNLRALELGRSL
ncbi:MAG: 2-oxoglutarate ferredoxin oxidoreductase subunit [Geobacteraceae bacterium]|nr:MAG: 2-oxoglutarate ferredoxin oxidoreductase subunit [Geobacteraceae bacterium]